MNVEHKQSEVKLEEEVNINKKKSNKGPYVLGEKLGEGAFAKVRLATQIHIKEKCAVKILEKKFLESSRDIQRLKKEIKILKKIRHKNIIQLYDIMESKRNLYFVMEYCKNGELFDYIVKKKRLKEPEACCFFQQIIDGVDYLHNQGIIHRDLKPENLLLDDNNHIKISDFGLSTFYSKNNYLLTACGTPSYAPPEMLEGHEYNGEATDVWSCGIILYAMLCGTLPFSESQEEIIVKKIKAHDYTIPNYLSHEAKDLLSHILIIDPKERINISQIKQHAWFNLVKPHLLRGINLEEDIIPIDDKILEMVKNYGFDPEECRTLLLKNKFCSLTTIYYLCLKKYVRENGKSISDLESDLYEEYINNPKNKIHKNKNKEEKGKEEKGEEENNNNNNNVKTERENTPNFKLSLKKLNTNKTNRNNIFNMKRNGTPTVNYIRINKEQRNLKSSKNIKKGYGLSDNTNHNKQVINYNKKKSFSKENETNNEKETLKITEVNKNNNNIAKGRENYNEKNKENIKDIKDSKNNEIKSETKNKYIITKNNSMIKSTISDKSKIKKINIKKNDIRKISMNESETKNNSINKKKIKDLNNNNNNNNKVKKSIMKVSNPKPIRHETEKKTITTKFFLNQDDNRKMQNNSINANVNIINININNNNSSNNFNGNISSKNSSSLQTISDKEISYIIKQKLKQINQKKCDEKNQNQNENKKKDNSFKILKEEEEELKALLSPLYLKDLNISNSQSNTLGSIMNNTNTSNLFSSIFQDSIPNQTKTFIGKPQNYSLKTENNVNDVSRPKSSLFQYLGNDIEKYMLIHGEKPINVINYIAKKLVASSFCGSLNFNSGFNSTYVNSNNNLINQTNSFFKERTESNNSLTKSNGNAEIRIENNSFDNSKDTSLFINDDNTNDDKDYNFKNLVIILNKKFKGYISQEKLNKSEVTNKNSVIENKIIKNSNTINKEEINGSINKIKKHENKNNLLGSFNKHIDHKNNNSHQSNETNSYILFSYSKNENSKAKKPIQKNKNNIEKNDKASKVFPTPKISKNNINYMNSHYNTFLDISTNYDHGLDSRNSSVEKSASFKKNPLRNFSYSPSHFGKEEKNIGSIHKIYNNKNTTFNRVMNLTKRNRNFNTISEDEEFKDFDKNKVSKKGKRYPIFQNKVTINLCSDENIHSSYNNQTNSRVKTRISKKK